MKISDLVELETGERLLINKISKDCDGVTDLYSLGITGYYDSFHGIPAESLTLVVDNNPATAAIAYALDQNDNDSLHFLHLWNEGEFQLLRDNWDNIPDKVFIGVEPFFKPTESELTCYQCDKPTTWLAPDSRCGDCTRYTPEEIRG